MRILFVVHQFFPEFHSGTERVALNLARVAQRAGHYVHILASAVDPSKLTSTNPAVSELGWLNTTFEGLPVTLIPRSSLTVTAEIGFDYDETLAQVLVHWVKALNFDVAHVLHTMRMGIAVRALQVSLVPYVLTLTDFFLPCARINLIDATGQECDGPDRGLQCVKLCGVPPWLGNSYIKRFEQSVAILAGASARVVPSIYVANKYRAAYPELGFRVVAHGIDLVRFAAHPALQAAEKDDSVLSIVFVGSIVIQKGLHILLNALRAIPNERLVLKIVGGFHGDERYRCEIESMVTLDKRVELLGSLDPAGISRILAASDLLCLPSQVPETFSLVFHESAAAGVPALVSNLGAPPAYLRQRACGGIVDASNPRAWAEAIAKIIAEPALLDEWRNQLFLPLRIEEEAFFYESMYRTAIDQSVSK